MPLVEVVDVWFYYDTQPALEGVNFAVHEGDFIALIGPNGGGKTTLLKIMAGLLKPTRGEVRLRAERLGYVPQITSFKRFFPLTVEETVEMGCRHNSFFLPRWCKKRVRNALEMVGLSEKAGAPLRSLSVGERQRTLVARALVSSPQLLLLDEPTSAVDPATKGSIYSLLKDLSDEGMGVVVASHDIGAISSHIKSVACLNRKLYHHDEKLTAEALNDSYQCPVELIAHGVPHRVFPKHDE